MYGWTYLVQPNESMILWCKSVRKQKTSYSLTNLNSVAASGKNSCCGSSISRGIDLAPLSHTALVSSADALAEFTLCVNLAKKKCFQYVCGKSTGRGNRARLWPLPLMFSEIHADSSWELSGKPQWNLFLLTAYKMCMICLLCVLRLEVLVSKSSGRLYRQTLQCLIG